MTGARSCHRLALLFVSLVWCGWCVAGEAAPPRLRLFVLGDCKCNDSSKTHRQDVADVVRAMYYRSKDDPPGLVINTGDLVDDVKDPRDWKRFSKQHAPLFQMATYLAVPGNHDKPRGTDCRSWFDKLFKFPESVKPAPEALPFCRAFVQSGAGFVLLDSEIFSKADSALPQKEIDWLSGALAALGEQHASPVMLFMHSPPFSLGTHYKGWDGKETTAFRNRMMELCRKHAVAAVFAGHEHYFGRAKLDMDGYTFQVVVTGGAGATLHTASVKVPDDLDAGQLFERNVGGHRVQFTVPRDLHHFLEVDIADKEMTVRVFEPDTGPPAGYYDEIVEERFTIPIPKAE